MKGFYLILGVLLESKGKEVLVPGMRPSFCRVLNGARKEIVLMLALNEWMDQTSEELKRERGFRESSSNI